MLANLEINVDTSVMQSPEQLRGAIERATKTLLATTAAALAIGGCATEDRQDTKTPSAQEAPTTIDATDEYMRVGLRGDVVPVNPLSGEPEFVPNEVIENIPALPQAQPGEKCFSEDASPAIVIEGGGYKKDPRTISTQTDTFHDAYEVDYRHLAGRLDIGYIQIIQEPADESKYSWMRIVTLNEIPKRGPGYVELKDSKPNTTIGMIVDTAKDPNYWADVTVQVCTPEDSLPPELKSAPESDPTPPPDDTPPAASNTL